LSGPKLKAPGFAGGYLLVRPELAYTPRLRVAYGPQQRCTENKRGKQEDDLRWKNRAICDPIFPAPGPVNS
jgi:hypothetical protein